MHYGTVQSGVPIPITGTAVNWWYSVLYLGTAVLEDPTAVLVYILMSKLFHVTLTRLTPHLVLQFLRINRVTWTKFSSRRLPGYGTATNSRKKTVDKVRIQTRVRFTVTGRVRILRTDVIRTRPPH